jgi:hypothetical protein
MSVSTRNRLLFFMAVLAFSTQALFAAFPSPRTAARLAWDPVSKQMVLFGGISAFDRGTGRSYELGETWVWNGQRWVQRFPSVAPSARYSHLMVTDTTRSRIILFGGARETSDLNDTWEYSNGTWKQLATPASPSSRTLPTGAYDPVRDRIVMFGGSRLDGAGAVTLLKDTWEFDGTTWVQRGTDGPELANPIVAYDAARNQTILVGTAANVVKMYRYDPAAGTWVELTPATKPPCAIDAAMSYDSFNQTVVLTGGVCSNSALTDEVWRWNGTDWAKSTTTISPDRMAAPAQAFDPERNVLVRFGGTLAFSTPRAQTYTLREEWKMMLDASSPAPRSLMALASDPSTGTVYLFGGFNDGDTYSDFWQYRNGQWSFIVATGGPGSCGNPNAAFDTDRNRLVVLCSDASVFEWDGTAWKSFSDLKTKPEYRRFSMMTYDQTLKRTVMFGGYNDVNYQNRTWLWDGTQWTEQKNNRPPARGSAAMWFDPILKKTVIYGGVGRPTPDDGVERYNDMWALDSNGWTKLTPSSTPGMRYGAQVAVDTRTTPNRVLLFGGLLYEEAENGEATTRTQTFQNDLWEWNGTAWKKLTTSGAPPARQNGAMVFDATRGEMVLFGGYGGYYFSDTWILGANESWSVRQEFLGRRRTATTRTGTTGPSVETPAVAAQ